MSMAGLGHAVDLWALPYHTVMNLRNEYLEIITPPVEKKDEETEFVSVAPGVQMEREK